MKELYVINHSGGKDSQAMYLLLSQNISAEQIVVIYAHLPRVTWPGTEEHIRATIGDSEFHVVQSKKTFMEMVDHRGMWPSPSNRQCTSDLKRGPIEKKIKEICNTRGFNRVINCMGLRAEESPGRAKKEMWRRVESKCNSRREWYEWLPIHDWPVEQVFGFIKANSQDPHWAYSAGMTRLSCCFCIMASEHDIKTAARLMPELYAEYVAKEKEIDHTMFMPSKKHGRRFLTDIVET